MVAGRTRRDFDQLSERRREAMALLDEGLSQADIAREFSVSRQTVSRWARLKDEYLDDEPWRRRRLGRPGGLTDEQKATFARKLVDSYVRGLGRRRRGEPKPARWTLARVAGMLVAEFGVSYSDAHVRNILVSLVGVDQPLLSRVSVWARLIELVYPEWTGRVLVEDFDDGWELDWRIVGELRRRLQS
ncbi:helix-turn-helix domain-containing protein [Trinickia mobilis]|uniref:helix-turn-helix domain-containing protein n=1 Tax=Trinickia mobilis TaxID=2816356 RepID=UPI002103AF45|nr:helix-turn-helix domain-containing protein [Trinickia mobilis]